MECEIPTPVLPSRYSYIKKMLPSFDASEGYAPRGIEVARLLVMLT
jgi:hypothetical protein